MYRYIRIPLAATRHSYQSVYSSLASRHWGLAQEQTQICSNWSNIGPTFILIHLGPKTALRHGVDPLTRFLHTRVGRNLVSNPMLGALGADFRPFSTDFATKWLTKLPNAPNWRLPIFHVHVQIFSASDAGVGRTGWGSGHWAVWSPRWPEKGGPNMVQEWPKSIPRVAPKVSQTCPKMGPGSGPKVYQKWPGHFWATRTLLGHSWATFGSFFSANEVTKLLIGGFGASLDACRESRVWTSVIMTERGCGTRAAIS